MEEIPAVLTFNEGVKMILVKTEVYNSEVVISIFWHEMR